MLERIKANLHRQEKGLILLSTLLEEEFTHLTGRDPKAVTGCEFSIQELIKQLAVERLELRGMVAEIVPGATSLRDLAEAMDEEESKGFTAFLQFVDTLEQKCAVMAEKNSRLAFGLAEQSKNMLDFIHKQIQPKNEDTYARNGRYQNHRPEAAIFRGRS
ncbi:flagellar protein FlgN [Desulfovibrio ferrophilus]|uniref:FlgN family protein n=1 Tax=Desulfovibrio ferrophilus TaxID=241368 RepID=A0A2Z6AXH0_9BACT|nr:flagellar protein FlgN [Desulfovibrio ferrophilus]BBD07908.1 FlgN family protein [Desulfovibrio ferrophilus]